MRLRCHLQARAIVLTVSLCQGILACTSPVTPEAQRAPNSRRISGKLLENVDAPPYSYLRLETETEELWVAVPVTSVEPSRRITVLNAVPVNNYWVPPLRRRLGLVYFGSLQRGSRE